MFAMGTLPLKPLCQLNSLISYTNPIKEILLSPLYRWRNQNKWLGWDLIQIALEFVLLA
jgi:hypothetical protein